MPPKKKPPSNPAKSPKLKRLPPNSSTTTTTATTNPRLLPAPLLQSLLTTFTAALTPLLPQPAAQHLPPLLQHVKQRLYARDFAAAFAEPELRAAYAARWSPSRAGGYAGLLRGLWGRFGLGSGGGDGGGETVGEDGRGEVTGGEGGEQDGGGAGRRRTWSVTCLGGGAGAEVVALAGMWRSLADEGGGGGPGRFEVRVVDVAAWREVLEALEGAATGATALVPADQFELEFRQLDLLGLSTAEVAALMAGADLVTVMFTLNELYGQSLARAQGLVLALREGVRKGGWLLVVDSPGSYSTVRLGGEERRYPMHWLLDHQLLGKGRDEEGKGKDGEEAASGAWEKVLADESVWFRMPEGMRYPIELENMRYQVHLYQKK